MLPDSGARTGLAPTARDACAPGFQRAGVGVLTVGGGGLRLRVPASFGWSAWGSCPLSPGVGGGTVERRGLRKGLCAESGPGVPGAGGGGEGGGNTAGGGGAGNAAAVGVGQVGNTAAGGLHPGGRSRRGGAGAWGVGAVWAPPAPAGLRAGAVTSRRLEVPGAEAREGVGGRAGAL